MKKITMLLAISIAFCFAASAQKNVSQIKEGVNLNTQFSVSHNDAKTTSYDTLWPTSINNGCDSLRLYSTENDTYLSGNNEYGDLEKGTLVKYTGNGTLTSVEAILYRAGTDGSGTCKVNVYSKGANLLPGALLGSSELVPVSALTTGNIVLVPFTFTTPIAVTSDFFVTVVLPTNAGDTVAIPSTSQYCSVGSDTLSVEKWEDGTWKYLKTAWGVNLDLFISAAVTTETGIANNAIENINVYATSNQIVVENNNNATIKQVSVYDLLGKEVAKYDVNSNGTVKLSTDFASSNYIVRVITDKKVGSYKLFVR